MATFQLTTLSQSSLQDYMDCQRRFKLRYLDRLSYPAAETEPALENERHIQEGEYFHRLVQQYLVGIPAEQVGRLANTPTLQRWWENFLGFGKSSLGDGARYLPEVTLSAPLGGHRLLAKYDLIAVRDGTAVIYDWKTYRRRPRTEWLSARMQTRVYRALLVQAGAHLNHGKQFEPEQIEMIYWFADFPDDPASFPYSTAQFQRDWDTLTKLEQEITTNVGNGQDISAAFPLTDDRQKCVYCTYRSYCERGVQAGDFESAEAEMEAESLFDLNFEQIGEIAF